MEDAQKMIDTINTLADLIGDVEGRVIDLERKVAALAGTRPERESKLTPGKGPDLLLKKVKQRGGVWGPDRALDALVEQGWDSEHERPESVAGAYLVRLEGLGYVKRLSRGRYLYTGKQ